MSDSPGRRIGAACATAYAGTLLALAWARELHTAYLWAASATVLATSALLYRAWPHDARQAGRRVRAWRLLLLGAATSVGAACAVGFTVEHRLSRIVSEWDALVARHAAGLHRRLDLDLERLLESGRRVADDAARRIAAADDEDTFTLLAALRARSDVAALAVFDGAGELIAWAGDHRGALPLEAKLGDRDVLYAERPLFGYLYVTRAVEGRELRVVAAILLQTGLAGAGQPGLGFASRFAAATGVRPFFAAGPGPPDSWSLVAGRDTVLHARFEPVTRVAWRADAADGGRRAVLPLAALALVFVSAAWLRTVGRSGRRVAAPLVGLAVALAIAPVGMAPGTAALFSPAHFLLPLPGEPTLGRLLMVLLPLAALTAGVRPAALEDRAGRAALGVGMLAVALGFAGGLRLLVAAAAPSLLEGGGPYWGGVQLAGVLALTMVAVLALPQTRPGPSRVGLAALGGFATVALVAFVLLRWRLDRTIDPWAPALWAVPFALMALGLMRYAGRGSRVLRWLVAGWLAATAALPHLWATAVSAKLNAAERELEALGPRPDPFLDYLLSRFADEAMRRDSRGEDGVELLYRSWVASGLAREAYPAWIHLWGPGGRPLRDLAVGDPVSVRRSADVSERRLIAEIERARERGRQALEPAPGYGPNGQILAVPLERGRAITVTVPPRRSLGRATILAPILGAEPRPDTRLTLIPVTDAGRSRPDTTAWYPTDHGWRSEKLVRYPDGLYHAHLELRLPSAGVLAARGVLLLAFDLALLAALWLVGRTARGDPPAPPGGWTAWLGSFRARITLALFAFFLIPTIVFGAAAYRALAGEAARTARVLAERAAAQAVAAYAELPGDWRAIADRIGEEVLYFHRGELAHGSSPEVVELGLFGAWMPPAVYAALQTGEEVGVVETRTLGSRPYVMAYRRLPAGTLAVPVSLAAGEAATRQRELAHLILFATLMGGLLSLALSVAVGRTLARPIGQLRRAAAAIGAGRLRVRLPGSGAGEFGELFASFNRMVRRLRRARAQELRTARVLAWGEMSRQVAHEIKNPLTPIKLSVQHLRRAHRDRRPDFGTILESNVEQILTEIDRLTEIARAFSRYGAPPEAAGPVEAVDVAAVVREALTLYRSGESPITFRLDVEDGLPPVRARGGELKEVLLNLLENARTALEQGGTITVTATRDGDAVTLAVVDDGPGIPAELLPRIFEPHFSTRSAGTGLGLAIVRRLVESWGGALDAESELGRGTAIRIRLPIAGEPIAASGS